jgi:hypothetical protein
MKYTHKGWFFLCPIYLNANDGEGMAVEARYEWLEWWFTVNHWIFDAMVFLIELVNPEYEPMFPFRVTGEVRYE